VFGNTHFLLPWRNLIKLLETELERHKHEAAGGACIDLTHLSEIQNEAVGLKRLEHTTSSLAHSFMAAKILLLVCCSYQGVRIRPSCAQVDEDRCSIDDPEPKPQVGKAPSLSRPRGPALLEQGSPVWRRGFPL